MRLAGGAGCGSLRAHACCVCLWALRSGSLRSDPVSEECALSVCPCFSVRRNLIGSILPCMILFVNQSDVIDRASAHFRFRIVDAVIP